MASLSVGLRPCSQSRLLVPRGARPIGLHKKHRHINVAGAVAPLPPPPLRLRESVAAATPFAGCGRSATGSGGGSSSSGSSSGTSTDSSCSAAANRVMSSRGASTSGRGNAAAAARDVRRLHARRASHIPASAAMTLGPLAPAAAAAAPSAAAAARGMTRTAARSPLAPSQRQQQRYHLAACIGVAAVLAARAKATTSTSALPPHLSSTAEAARLAPLAAAAAAAARQRQRRAAAPPPPRATFAASPGDDELLDRSSEFVEGTTGWRRRWTVVLLCFVAFMLCNMDRVNMSVAILPMSQQYAWDSRTVGLVQSSFFWGYLLTQVLGGIWADRYGGKLVLGLGVVWWSLATALTPIAAAAGLPALLVARALMGIGEGVAMPAMNNMLSRWVPVAERSRSLALVYSGMFIGSILGLGLSPHMIAALGWPSVFYVFGSMGVAWYAFWRGWAASAPANDPKLSPEERAYILANTSAGAKGARRIPWRLLLSRREVWAIIVCHFCHNWGTFILLTWMPTYYNQVLGLDVMASGAFSVLPWVTMAISANLGGWIADGLVARGASVTAVRKAMQTLGFLGPAFFLSQLPSVTSAGGAVACMMGAQGFDAFSQSGLYSNHQDIGPKYAGVLLGLSNTAGVLAGVLGSLATGHILAHGTWADVWRVAVALYLVGTVVWNVFSTGERIFD